MKHIVHKWIIPITLFIGLITLPVGCQRDLREDVDDLIDRVSWLEKICDQVNTDIGDLKQIVSLLEANDYITSVNELADKSGYAINFLKGNTIVIKHGTNGEYPVIGVEEFENVFYWTQKVGDNPPSWIVDSKGNKVKTTGVNGKTPVVGINTNGNWTIDYGEGSQEIKVNGKPVPAKGKDGMNGADGKDGADGSDGYSPFQSVVDKGDYVEIKLTTGVVLKLLKLDSRGMKIRFDLNEENLISDVMYLNEEIIIPYEIENPDPQATIYFDATNGWTVEHDPDNKFITVQSYAAWDFDGRIIASVIKEDRLISQFRFSVRTNMLRPLNDAYIIAEPQPLEAIGGKVPVTINMTFPARWFNRKAIITVTPVLRYAGGEAWGTSYTYQGEKVEGNDQVISLESCTKVTMKSSFSYVPEMKKSELYLTFKVKIGGIDYTLPDVKIGDGVI